MSCCRNDTLRLQMPLSVHHTNHVPSQCWNTLSVAGMQIAAPTSISTSTGSSTGNMEQQHQHQHHQHEQQNGGREGVLTRLCSYSKCGNSLQVYMGRYIALHAVDNHMTIVPHHTILAGTCTEG